MNGFIGAFGVNTAEFPHQQAGNDRRYGVRNFVSQHQRDHQHQTENCVRRLAVRRRGVINLNGHIQHHKVTTPLSQQRYLPPVPHHQHDIAKLQSFIGDRAVKSFTIAFQTHDVQIETGTKGDFAHRLANQFGIRDQGDFRHPYVQRLIGKVFAAQHHGLQHLLAAELT